MREVAFAFSVLLLFPAAAQQVRAQEYGSEHGETAEQISLGQLTPTAEMWFYDQARQAYNDPKAAVRRKAEFASAQRQRRLAAQRWFGISNSRPIANPIPWFNSYSPVWSSNTSDPNHWSAVGGMPVYYFSRRLGGAADYGLW